MHSVEIVWKRSETSRKRFASYCIIPVATLEWYTLKWPDYVWENSISYYISYYPTIFQEYVQRQRQRTKQVKVQWRDNTLNDEKYLQIMSVELNSMCCKRVSLLIAFIIVPKPVTFWIYLTHLYFSKIEESSQLLTKIVNILYCGDLS